MDHYARLRDLLRQGYGLLAEGEYARAAAIGVELAGLRHPAGFELQALERASRSDLEGAIRILRDGLRISPWAWELWDLVGIYHTESEQFAEAHAAFEEALLCPEVSESDIHIHAADALRAQGRHDEALERVAFAEPGTPTFLRAEATRAATLSEAGRSDEAIETARTAIRSNFRRADADLPWVRMSLAQLHAILGRELLANPAAHDQALESAWRAIELDRCNADALHVIRVLTGASSPQAKRLRVHLRGVGVRRAGEPAAGPTYDVVADSEAEALELLRPFEAAVELEPSALVGCEDLGGAPGEHKGVVAVWRDAAASRA